MEKERKKKEGKISPELGPQNSYPFKPSRRKETYEHNFIKSLYVTGR